MSIKSKFKAHERHFEKFIEILEENPNFRAWFNDINVSGYSQSQYAAEWVRIGATLDTITTVKKIPEEWEEVSCHMISFFLNLIFLPVHEKLQTENFRKIKEMRSTQGLGNKVSWFL